MYMEDIGQCIMRCIENYKEYCFKIYNDFWKDREHIYSPVFTIESELESELESKFLPLKTGCVNECPCLHRPEHARRGPCCLSNENDELMSGSN